jgi:hypothetical protein
MSATRSGEAVPAGGAGLLDLAQDGIGYLGERAPGTALALI